MQVSINNNTVSMQVAEILPILLRMYDPETLAKYDSLTPTTLDQLSDYADAVMKLPFTPGFGAASQDPVVTMIPSAAAASSSDYAAGRTFQQYLSFNNNTLGYDQFRTAGSSHYHRPRGSFKIDQIYFSADGKLDTARLPARGDDVVYVRFTVTEPLFVPPFLTGSDCEGHHPGFYAVSYTHLTLPTKA